MSGYNLILKIRRMEQDLAELGMRWGHDKHGWRDHGHTDVVSIFPLDDKLPVYSRDACLFTGSIADVDQWLNGVKWARDYDMLLRVSDDKKRARREQDELNRQIVKRIKNEELGLKE